MRRGFAACRAVRAFTLLEAVVALALLSLSVLALTQAVSAGQMQSQESQKQVLASMAAADALSEITSLPYASIAPLNGETQAVGQMRARDGAAYPSTYWALGRRIAAVPATTTVSTGPGQTVTIPGVQVTATVSDARRDVVSLSVFIAEPAP